MNHRHIKNAIHMSSGNLMSKENDQGNKHQEEKRTLKAKVTY